MNKKQGEYIALGAVLGVLAAAFLKIVFEVDWAYAVCPAVGVLIGYLLGRPKTSEDVEINRSSLKSSESDNEL